MTNYYIEKDNKIIFVDINLERLQNTVALGEYAELEIKETDRPIVNFEFADTPEYIEAQKLERENWFKTNFFSTSLGWIRRNPQLANGQVDNFLNDNLPLFAIAVATNQAVSLPIAYLLPDFEQELTKEYLETLQVKNQPITQQFINECLMIKQSDFSR